MSKFTPLDKLIKAREEKGLTQEQLAKLADISRQNLSHIERGASLPSLAVAFRISKALNKSIEQIFFSKKAQSMSNKSA